MHPPGPIGNESSDGSCNKSNNDNIKIPGAIPVFFTFWIESCGKSNLSSVYAIKEIQQNMNKQSIWVQEIMESGLLSHPNTTSAI